MLSEPGQVRLLGGQAHVQALLGRALPVTVRRGPLVRRRQRGAGWLPVVWPGFGERVRVHEPPSVRKKIENTPYEQYSVLTTKVIN